MRLRNNPLGMSVAADPELRTPPSRGAKGRPPHEAMKVPLSVTVIRVGPQGKRTHIYDVNQPGSVLCGSGTRSPNGETGNRNVPELYDSDAQFVTCVRCQKLGKMNMRAHDSFLSRPD